MFIGMFTDKRQSNKSKKGPSSKPSRTKTTGQGSEVNSKKRSGWNRGAFYVWNHEYLVAH